MSKAARISATTVTRRGVVLGGMSLGGTALLFATGVQSAQAAPSSLTLPPSDLTNLRVRVLNGPLVSFRWLEMPLRLRLREIDRGADVTITVAYDARVFAFYAASAGAREAQVESLEFTTSIVDWSAITEIHVPRTLTERDIYLGVSATDSYPNEGVDDPISTTILVNGNPVSNHDPEPAVPVAVWGLEVYPAWVETQDVADKGSTRYRYPIGARVRSVGAAASPPDLPLAIVYDERVLSSLALEESSTTSLGSVAIGDGSAEGFTMLVLPSIPAGEDIFLKFAAIETGLSSPLATVRQALIEVTVPPSNDSVIVRTTSRYVVADRTSSGNSTVPNTMEGSI